MAFSSHPPARTCAPSQYAVHSAVILPFPVAAKQVRKIQRARPKTKPLWQPRAHPFNLPALLACANYSLCLSLVAACCRIAPHHLIAHTRVRPHISFARHLALYLLGVTFDLSCYKLMGITARSHKTCTTALAAIEDKRDDPRFDALCCHLERAIHAHCLLRARFALLAAFANPRTGGGARAQGAYFP